VDIDCTENVHNKSLVYTGTQTSSKLLISGSKSQGQETYCFEGAHIEFPSHWDFNSVSETAKELSNTCQTNAKYHMPNTICQIADTKTNAKHEMPKIAKYSAAQICPNQDIRVMRVSPIRVCTYAHTRMHIRIYAYKTYTRMPHWYV